MSDFDKWKYRYENGYATENHIFRLVSLGVLTAIQYKDITGLEYLS